MIIPKEFLGKIKDLGLNSYETRLWTALLSRGISTAGELSDIANVPRSRSYDILESLEKKGFIIMKLGKPIKYIAVSPQIVVERVQKKVHEDALKHVELLENIKDSKLLSELITLHTKGIDMVNPADLIGIFKGRNNLYNHIEAMIKSAKKSVSIITSEDGISRKLEYFSDIFRKITNSGVSVRVIVPSFKKKIELKKNFEIKIKPSVNSRFILVDNKELVFMLVDDAKTYPSYDVGVWVTSPFFVSSFDTIFNHLWKIN